MKPFDYAVAENAEGAHAALAAGYRPKAGGIDLLDMMKERIGRVDKIVSITPLAPSDPITRQGDTWRLDAQATLRQLVEHSTLAADHPALSQSVAEAASPQIRERATIGGNLLQRPRCWYYRLHEYPCLKRGGSTCYAVDGDNRFHAIIGGGPCHIVHPSSLAPAVVALGATLHLTSSSGERSVPAAEFFQLPRNNMYGENVLRDDELLTHLTIPVQPGARSASIEFKEKQAFDWPMSSCTAAWNGSKWSIVMGFVAPIPWRSEAAEAVLGSNADPTPELAEQAADAAIRDAEPMSDNAWRIKLARASVRRAILKATGKEYI